MILTDEEKDKSAFITQRGVFQLCRMSFSLVNAPVTYQRVTDCVLRRLLRECCMVYLDNVVVYSRGSQDRAALCRRGDGADRVTRERLTLR